MRVQRAQNYMDCSKNEIQHTFFKKINFELIIFLNDKNIY